MNPAMLLWVPALRSSAPRPEYALGVVNHR